jgi:hypothetical protein
MRTEQRKAGPIKGCILPIIGFAGFIALCYVFCYVLFLLGSPGAQSTTGALLPFLG